MKNSPLSRRANLVVQEMDGETLVYDLTENKAFCLNESSAIIWQLCDGQRNVEQIAGIMTQQYSLPVNEDFVWFAIDQLKKENLIENKSELDNYFLGLSRREVIKKVGIGTMIALPVVAGIIAPQAIQAASPIPCSCPNGQVSMATSCTDSPQCMAPTGTCTGVTCNNGGNNCGTLNGVCI